jgi:DNA polymerase alpha subunit B
MGAVIGNGNGNDNDAQLEHIVSSSRQTSSPQKSSQSPTVLITPPKSKASSPSINVNYENRENAGVTVVSYNPNKLEPIISSSVRAAARNCLITQPFKSHLSKGYRYMTDKNRHDPLNAQLVRMTEAMMECHGIQSPTDEEEDSNAEQQQQQQQVGEDDKKHIAPYECVGVPRQSLQTNIGRVCNEAHDGKLNATTLLLEGSKFGSGGARIELDVSNVDHYSLFQGQIIGVSGINLNGRKMMVETLIEGLDYKATDINVDADVEVETNMNMSKETFGQEGVKIYAVAGPYTTNNNLEYQPLTDLLGVVEEEKPDVVVMMGPFVDMKHELVKNGEDLVLEYEDGTKRHVCYEQFFAAKIASELEALYEAEPELKTQFILVPSMDDAVSEPV